MQPLSGDLTGRELEVLRLVALGHTNARAGAALFLASSTVKTHLRRIQVKLGASDRAHSVALAVAMGLLVVGYGDGQLEVTTGQPGARAAGGAE